MALITRFFCILMILATFSCTEESVETVTVSFEETDFEIVEDYNYQSISISTAEEVKEYGTVDIVFEGSAEYGVDFESDPAAVNGRIKVEFPPYTQVATYRIRSLENKDKDYGVTVTSSLTNESGGIAIGKPATNNTYITNIDAIKNVAFQFESHHTPELERQLEVEIFCDYAVDEPGQLYIDVIEDNMELDKDYELNYEVVDGQIIVDFEEGTYFKNIIVNLLDNDVQDGDGAVTFRMDRTEGGIRIDRDRLAIREHNIYVADDESPVEVNFKSDNPVTIQEGEEYGTTFFLETPYSPFWAGNVKIEIETEAVYDVHYTTSPPLQNGYLNLNVTSYQESFNIIPIDDGADRGNFSVKMTLVQASDGVRLGTDKLIQTATIVDND